MKKSTAIVGTVAMMLLLASLHFVTENGSFTGALGGAGTLRERVRRYTDVNADGATNAVEMRAALVRVIRGIPSGNIAFDVNGDGIVNAQDSRSMVQALRGILVPRCGDGEVDAGEQCDDGGTVSGDGCTSACVIEQRHLACVDFACTYVSGSGANECQTAADCAPTYGITVEIPSSASQPISPAHPTTFDVLVTADSAQANMAVDIDFPGLYDGMLNTWEADPRCEPLAGSDKRVVCTVANIDPSHPVRFTFTLQPYYFPNCAITPSIDADVTVRYDRSYAQGEALPFPRRLAIPLQCLTSASLTNIRPVAGTPVALSSCTNGKLGNGGTDQNFYFASAWVDTPDAGHIFASLTGNATAHLTYDPTGHLLNYQQFGLGGRSFVRDAVWDEGNGVAYLFVQQFDPTSNAFAGEFIVEYDVVSNAVVESTPVNNAGGYFGMSSTPIRRAVMKDGKAYFFPLYAFNTQLIYYVNSYDPVANVAEEVMHTGDVSAVPTYPSAPADVYKPEWKQCFLRTSNAPPLQIT